MKKLICLLYAIGAWIGSTILLYIGGVLSFPVDASNTLIAPGWYILLLAFAPIFVAVVTLIKSMARTAKKTKTHPLATAIPLDQSLCDKAPSPPHELTPPSDLNEDFATYGGINAEMLTVDMMDGLAFEHYCADILSRMGFSHVEVTRGSGDQGVDVLAEKDGVKYAIQCKCYTSDLGNAPVQEVNAGKAIYRCHIGAVLTNRFFTRSAREAADATGVLLWDRDKLKELIQGAKNL